MMSVLLQKPLFDTVSNQELVVQMEARKKSEKKLPTWFNTTNIYYPKKLNIEQTSSEVTAEYKSRVVAGKSLVDLTGGFGVDSYFFAAKLARVVHCEIDSKLSKIARHNFEVLGADNITSVWENGISFLKRQQTRFDWLYLDPSRRNPAQNRVFKLSDCTPNVLAHLNLFFDKSNNILIKTSPLLDIAKGIIELKNVCEIHVIAVENEVKELLWVLRKGYKAEIELKTIHIGKTFQQVFDFIFSEEKQETIDLSPPLDFLYEPNAAIMKSGGFKTIGKRFNLKKLHPNTHLYTSDALIDFPGRRFKIENVLPYRAKALKILEITKANVAVRNFPESVAEIRKRYGMRDGGKEYLYFITTVGENKMMLSCSKV